MGGLWFLAFGLLVFGAFVFGSLVFDLGCVVCALCAFLWLNIIPVFFLPSGG